MAHLGVMLHIIVIFRVRFNQLLILWILELLHLEIIRLELEFPKVANFLLKSFMRCYYGLLAFSFSIFASKLLQLLLNETFFSKYLSYNQDNTPILTQSLIRVFFYAYYKRNVPFYPNS